MALTPVQSLFDAFFVLIESDEWDSWEDSAVETDLSQIMLAAIPWFKFPRCSFATTEAKDYFEDDKVSNYELQVLALFMKSVWYGRVIDSWEKLRPAYSEADFSPAAQLREFNERQKSVLAKAKDLESIYYRSIKGRPFDYTKLSGGSL